VIFDIDYLGGGKFRINTWGSSAAGAAYAAFKNLEVDVRQKWWHVQDGDFVVDVGAGFGSYTIPALAAGARLVAAFEPSPDPLFCLCSNAALNILADRLMAVPFLLGTEDGVNHNFYPEGHSTRYMIGKAESRIIIRLDTFVDSYQLPQLDWLKIDVEGAEVDVLNGSLESIKRFKPKILVENHKGLIADVDEQVRSLILPLGYGEETYAGSGVNEHWSFFTPV